MATSLNVAKLANVLRGRLILMQEFAETYKPSISRHKEKLMELIKEKSGIATKAELARKMRELKGFYTLEVAPPNINEFQRLVSEIKLTQEFFKKKDFNHFTVRQAWLLFLVCTEIGLWFFLGETIGKRHIVGYSV